MNREAKIEKEFMQVFPPDYEEENENEARIYKAQRVKFWKWLHYCYSSWDITICQRSNARTAQGNLQASNFDDFNNCYGGLGSKEEMDWVSKSYPIIAYAVQKQ